MTTRAPRLLIWGSCALNKRGSFEDYLLAVAAKAVRDGISVRICAEGFSDELIGMFALGGVSIKIVATTGIAGAASFVTETIMQRPDILHCHFGSPSTWHASFLRAASFGRSHTIVTDHGSRTREPEKQKSGHLSKIKAINRRLLARSVALYLPVSDYVATCLKSEVKPCSSRVTVLKNAVDLDRNRPSFDDTERTRLLLEKTGLPADDVIVAFVGQLTAEKGVPTLLQVQERVLSERDNVSFLWVGDGALRAQVAGKQGPRCKLLGRRDDVPDLLRGCDILVAPSIWQEAFSLALAEAAAAGIPVVASRVGGIPEVVEDGVTGILVSPSDPEALTVAILSLVDDKQLRLKMGVAARQRAENVFDLRRMVNATTEHYRALLSSTKRSNRWRNTQ